MLKAEDLARREDRRVKGVKIGKTRRDRGISHVWAHLWFTGRNELLIHLFMGASPHNPLLAI